MNSSSATGNTWSNGDTSQSIVVSNSGNFSVTVSNGFCSATSTPTTVTVNPVPTTPTITAIGNTTFCIGDSVLLYSSNVTGNYWSNGSNSQSVYIKQIGLYTVQFTDINGCSATSSPIVVNVLQLPQVIIAASGPLTFCQGESVILTSSPANTYFWSNGSTTQSITVNQPGTYNVSITGSNSCSNISSPVNIVVNNNTYSSLTETGIDSFTLNGQTYTQSGTYIQVIPNVLGCDSTITLNLSLNYLGLNNMNSNVSDLLSIFPNPTQNMINVKADIKLIGEIYKIYDNMGRVVLTGKLNNQNTTIMLGNLSAGIYLFSVGAYINQNYKLIKE